MGIVPKNNNEQVNRLLRESDQETVNPVQVAVSPVAIKGIPRKIRAHGNHPRNTIFTPAPPGSTAYVSGQIPSALGLPTTPAPKAPSTAIPAKKH